jgi:hypothetical protein
MKKMLAYMEYMLCGVWFLLGGYAFWFLSKAKTYQPITLDELACAWKLHKREAGCNASQIHDLLIKKDQVVGFKCACGYEWLQKRPISQKVHLPAQNDKPQSVSEIEGLLKEDDIPAPDLGVTYLNVKRV